MKVINSFTLDTKNIRGGGEARALSVSGENGAVFSLEVKSGSNYYNFQTNLFQANKTRLSNVLVGNDVFDVNIIFPLVSAGAKYDIYLTAEGDTEHADYREVRFLDGSMDINSTTGSNSRLVQKVIYQTLDVTVTINGYSPNGTVTGTNTTSATISASREKTTVKTPFTCKFTSTSTRTLSINKQPVSSDITALVTATVGSPVDMPGEAIYPAGTPTFSGSTVNGAITSGAIVEIDADVAGNVTIGDRVTTGRTQAAIASIEDGGSKLTLDGTTCGAIMAVGDEVTTDTLPSALINKSVHVVSVINDGGTDIFTISPEGGGAAVAAVAELAGLTLTFSSKVNRSLTTVASLDPSGEAKQFTLSQDIKFRDNAPLIFDNRRNYKWEISSTSVDLSKLAIGMKQKQGTYFTVKPTVRDVDNRGIRPLIVRDGTTKVVTTTIGSSTNPINIEFDQQALLAFGGGANAEIFSYGEPEINRLTSYDVEFSDLAVSLAGVSTTTTAAVNASTSVPITQRAGIMDGISSVSGIGIDASAVNPTVASGAGSVTGAGTIVLSAAQTLEDGITLTFPGAGTVATITGNIKINHVGNEDVVLRFDLEKFLTMH
jgi:hypothetical protein